MSFLFNFVAAISTFKQNHFRTIFVNQFVIYELKLSWKPSKECETLCEVIYLFT